MFNSANNVESVKKDGKGNLWKMDVLSQIDSINFNGGQRLSGNTQPITLSISPPRFPVSER